MKRLKIFILCLACILLTGCINNKKGDRNVFLANTDQNRLNYKQNIFSEQGKVCAFYNEKIYYFSDCEEPGIYSMDVNGKNLCLEVPVEHIRKLQITENGIYYAAQYDDMGRYSLFYKEWNGDIKEYLPDGYLDLHHYLNVWDFYIGEDGLTTVIEVYPTIPRMILSLRAFMLDADKKIIPLAEYQDYLLYFNAGEEKEGICVSGFRDIVFTTGTGFEERAKYFEDNHSIDLDERNMTVFNRKTNEILLMRNEAMFFDVHFDGIVQTIYKDKFIISGGNCLYWVQTGSSEASVTLELPDIQEIKYSVQTSGKLLVAGANGNGNESVYEVDLEKGEIKNTYAVDFGENVLGINDGHLYTVSRKAAYVYKIADGDCKQVDKVKWEKKLKKSSRIEMAGNTVFVYNVSSWKNAGEFVFQESHELK